MVVPGRTSVLAFLVGLGVLLPSLALAQAPPVGPEFQVNSYTTGRQYNPKVAAAPEGSFVVVWDSIGSYGTDSSGRSIQGQRYAADGSPVGGEFQINSYTPNLQEEPTVAFGPGGDSVVVWLSVGSPGDDTSGSIQGQRFGSDGDPVGGQFQVNTFTPDSQRRPNAAVDSEGNFIVVWESFGQDSSSMSVQGQRFASDATPLGDEFQVNTYTDGSQAWATVGIDADGDFVVVWRSDGSTGDDSSSFSVQGQRYAADGTPLGGNFQVNTYTTGAQSEAHVAVHSDGSFLVVWRSEGSTGTDTNLSSIQGRLYDSNGSPLGDEFQLNAYTTGAQRAPRVAMDAGGGFTAVWESTRSAGTDSSEESIQVRRFASDGTPLDDDFQVNTYTTLYQTLPAVGVQANGNFVVTWQSYGSSGSDSDFWSIQAQRYGPTIFIDGFESGDTSAWSGVVP